MDWRPRDIGARRKEEWRCECRMDGSSRRASAGRCALARLRDLGGCSGIRTHFLRRARRTSLSPSYIRCLPCLLHPPPPMTPIVRSPATPSNYLPSPNMSSTTTWNTLPAELKLSVVDLLDLHDVKSLSLVNREAHSITVPSIFRVRALVLLPPIDTSR